MCGCLVLVCDCCSCLVWGIGCVCVVVNWFICGGSISCILLDCF